MSDKPQADSGVHLQQFGLKDSSYERPNQNWVCGHLCDGTPCAAGPDAKGNCVATAECRPMKKGDRWVCTRRDNSGAPSPCDCGPSFEGGCAHPIAKCSPVRSIRARRGRFAFGAFALSVGVLSFFIFGPQRSAFVEPGDLTDAHAQVLKAHRASDCSACHTAGAGNAGNWLKLAISPSPGAVQNEKCLVCHKATLGEDAALPHSLAAIKLQHIATAAHATGAQTFEQTVASVVPAPATTPQGDVACATCHQEHQGRHQNLATLADISCQVCHRQQFESFAHGHPEFKSVHQDRAGIEFEHRAHASRMPDGKLECARCHRPDPAGRTMQFTGFEQACAACHDSGKPDHHGDQIRKDIHVVFQLPAMSLDKPAYWPATVLAKGDKLTPMMQFLIAGDENPAALGALKSLATSADANGSPGDDWDDAPAGAKAQLAAAIKRVVKELSLSDEPAPKPSNQMLLRARIARAACVLADSPAVTQLVEQLVTSGNLTQAWQQHAIPRLADDLANKLPSTGAPDDAAAAAWKFPVDTSGWFIDSDGVSVNYHPSHANALDKSWIDVLTAGIRHSEPKKITEATPNPDYLAALRIQLLTQHGGSCVKCHAIQSVGESYFVNWSAAGHATRVAGYVKFDHRPHLTLFTGDQQCAVCHKLESGSPAATVLLIGGTVPNHGLAAHDKAACAACHAPAGAPDSCLTCHVYHMTR